MTQCSGWRYLGFGGNTGPLQPMPQQFTSWNAVHQTLLQELPQKRYHRGAAIEVLEHSDRGVTVSVAGEAVFDARVLIAGDGAQSPTRRRLFPNVEADYAGYVAWRGTVDERGLPPDLVTAFDDVFTFSDARSGGHALAFLSMFSARLNAHCYSAEAELNRTPDDWNSQFYLLTVAVIMDATPERLGSIVTPILEFPDRSFYDVADTLICCCP